MPLTTLSWRVVAMTPSGYVEGYRSLLADSGPMRFSGHPSNVQALREAGGIAAVRRLAWFNRGFMRARTSGDQLELADLRMGIEPDYFFRFVVAQRDGDAWQPLAPRQLNVERDFSGLWRDTWDRVLHGDAAAPRLKP